MALQRALISLSDKQGSVGLAQALQRLGVEIVSTGGTATALESAGIAVSKVSSITHFPEILDGRVKTLHPAIHGGLLARMDLPAHTAELKVNGITPIGLIAVNLYPFQKTIADPAHTFEDAIENIDIGGPTLLRAAAKNFEHVIVLVDPADYEGVLSQLSTGQGVDHPTRLRLAVKAFDHVAAYDDAISNYLSAMDPSTGSRGAFPATLNLQWSRKQLLRYGENPHQNAAFYADHGTREGLGVFEQLHGKELSYNNLLDLDAALRIAADFEEIVCAIIKHNNPAGAALGKSPADAFRRALLCDPLSAFGGIIAFNRTVDLETATHISEQFYELVAAPAFAHDALALLREKKNIRLLRMPNLVPRAPSGSDLRRVIGGVLTQSWDSTPLDEIAGGKMVTEKVATAAQLRDLGFAWKICKHVKSNAIVFVKDGATLGVGAGQMSRLDSVKIARRKAQEAGLDLKGSVAASDAFFPFRDGLDAIAEAGVSAIAQPGGSLRDDEVIAAANEHALAMVFTGYRHFKH